MFTDNLLGEKKKKKSSHIASRVIKLFVPIPAEMKSVRDLTELHLPT